MGYNLLRDTSNINCNSWKFINCKYENGYLVSNNKYFGISQELILPDPTKLYLRFNYKSVIGNITKCIVGIQNDNILESNEKIVKLNKPNINSVIANATQEKITTQLIFESTSENSKIEINEPLLCDLNYLHKNTWLKSLLDRCLHFRNGYTYENLLENELKEDSFNFPTIKAKIGCLCSTLDKLEHVFDKELIIGHYYLAKLDFKEVNKLGNVSFKYWFRNSTNENEQIYIVFQQDKNNKLKLIIEGNDVLPYQINLKNILLIDITNMNLLIEDIISLPFI